MNIDENVGASAPRTPQPPPLLVRAVVLLLAVCVCVAIPLACEFLTTSPPQERQFHIESFRYGTSPSILRVNRGDSIDLTFSTRDTGHSFLLQDYRVEARVAPSGEQSMIEVRDPLDTAARPEFVHSLHLTAGLPGWWGRLVSVSRFRCHTYCGPMHGFEQGDLIVRPNLLLALSMGLLTAMAIIGYFQVRWGLGTPAPECRTIDLNRRVWGLSRLLRWRPLQYLLTLPALAGLILAGFAGLFGTQVAGRNFAVMLTWAVWMSLLTLVLIPWGGRIWCLVCPLPSLGEYIQRGSTIEVRPGKTGRYRNRFFGLVRRWPSSMRGPWLRLFLFFGLGVFSASLAGQPRWTAVTLLALAAVAILVSLVWELRAFCRYICPVGAYLAVFSSAGRLMVRKRDDTVCASCAERACLLGSEKGWACPYGLCVRNIDSNADCGLCIECFKTCPHDNVSLAWRSGVWTGRFRSLGEAWQVIVLLVLAMTYSLTVHSPWPVMRDLANVVDKSTWLQFGAYAASVGGIAFVLAPLAFWLAVAWGLRRSGSAAMGTKVAFLETMPALVPLGLAFWASFFISTIMVNATYIALSVSDPFGKGWDFLGIAGMPWVQIWPSGIPWLQAGITLTGLAFGLRQGYRQWSEALGDPDRAMRAFVPMAALMFFLSAGMLIYFTAF